MKRIGNRKLRVKIQLIVFKKNKPIHRTTKQSKAAIYKEIKVFQTQKPNKWAINVYYGAIKNKGGSKTNLCNCGEYRTLTDLMLAIKVFTEKKLLDEVEQQLTER